LALTLHRSRTPSIVDGARISSNARGGTTRHLPDTLGSNPVTPSSVSSARRQVVPLEAWRTPAVLRRMRRQLPAPDEPDTT
jgi:hypothetical protein